MEITDKERVLFRKGCAVVLFATATIMLIGSALNLMKALLFNLAINQFLPQTASVILVGLILFWIGAEILGQLSRHQKRITGS